MNKKTFSDGSVIHFGWDKMKEYMGFFVLLFLVMFGASLGWIILSGIFMGFVGEDYWYLIFLPIIGHIVLGTIMGVGFTKIMLDVVDGKAPKLATLFTQWGVFFKFLAAVILYGLVVYIGLLLFVFPGMIWATKFYLAPFLVVDKGMGPIEAMKKSSELTMGRKWDVFGYMAVMKAVNTLGMFCCMVGMIFTIPATMIGTAKMYRELS